jgi:hypothetical protein
VIHEGLYQYLSMDEKEQLAHNIRHILQRFGGVWITPDFATQEDSQRWFNGADATRARQRITKLTGRDFADRAFDNHDHIGQFLTRLGFHCEVVPQIDGSFELSSLEQEAGLSAEFQRLKKALKLWIMTLDQTKAAQESQA